MTVRTNPRPVSGGPLASKAFGQLVTPFDAETQVCTHCLTYVTH